MTSRRAYGWAGEVAVIALTLAVTAGMTRLFLNDSFLRDVMALAIASHLVAIASRRAGLGMAPAGLLSLAALLVTVTVLLYADTAALILPTGDTIDLVRTDISEAWTVFNNDAAPVPVVPGFVLIAGTLLWICAFLADWAAFRLRSPIEAVAPATAVFVFTALLGVDADRIYYAVLYTGAVTAVLLTMRVSHQLREEVWIEATPARGAGSTLRAGAAVGALAVLIGASFGPALPGTDAAPLIDVTELDTGPQTRTTINPLVEVRTQLISQSNEELFSVAVPNDSPQYWRLMSLDEWDEQDQRWVASANFEDPDGNYPSQYDDSVDSTRLIQRITVKSALSNPYSTPSIYMPAAHEVVRVLEDNGVPLEYEASSGTLVKTREAEGLAPDGFVYVVESAVPGFDSEILASSTRSGMDASFYDFNTRLSDNVPATIVAEAESVTAGLTNDFDRALALQNYFLNSERFSYDIDIAGSHGYEDLESFLFEVGRGYCQQFAAAFAVMARSIGLPTRVAVGFTWGDWDESRGEYVVKGEHAHAWPEVYFQGTGWVILDPTPNRAPPEASNVTGHAPAQVGTAAPEPPPTSLPNQAGDPNAGGGPSRPFEEFPTTTQAPVTGPSSGVDVPWLTVSVMLLAAAFLVGFVPSLRMLQRKRRRARVAHDVHGRVEMAWDEALEALELIDIRHRPHESPMEFASRVNDPHLEIGPVDVLAEGTTHARYAAHASDELVADVERSSRAIAHNCRRSSRRGRRIQAAFDPRPLVPQMWRR